MDGFMLKDAQVVLGGEIRVRMLFAFFWEGMCVHGRAGGKLYM